MINIKKQSLDKWDSWYWLWLPIWCWWWRRWWVWWALPCPSPAWSPWAARLWWSGTKVFINLWKRKHKEMILEAILENIFLLQFVYNWLKDLILCLIWIICLPPQQSSWNQWDKTKQEQIWTNMNQYGFDRHEPKWLNKTIHW